jgi:uncharacterized protein (DUF488 family)
MELLTVGHGTLPQEQLGALLTGSGVERLVDVRTAPGSRRHPHVSRAALEVWLPRLGIPYSWEPRLGGWRKPHPDSRNTALRNDSFRGYADYMRTPPFWEAIDEVLSTAAEYRTAVMCSEAVYWRCHRRLIADAAEIERDVVVRHLGHDRSLARHRLTDGVRGDGNLLLYDSGAPRMWNDRAASDAASAPPDVEGSGR